jgi:hypothetical protein
MPAGPLLTRLEIGLSKVKLGIQIAERFRDCLDALSVHSRDGINGTRLVVLARFVRGYELCGHGDQMLGLVLDLLAIVSFACLTSTALLSADPCCASPESETENGARIPSPVMPGLHAVM